MRNPKGPASPAASFFAAAALFLLPLCLSLVPIDGPEAAEPVALAPTIPVSSPRPQEFAPDRFLAHIKYLSSDALEGRRTGEPGADTAAVYIAARFREAGLRPLGDNGTYLQHFEATVGVKSASPARLVTLGPSGERTWRPDSDFTALGFSENGTKDKVPVVFVGYGITAPDRHYDDYAGVDVKGKAVLFFRHIPAENDTSGPFGRADRSSFADLRYKANNAHNHGAVAALVVLDPLHHVGEPDEPLPLLSDQGIGGAHIPVLSLRREVAERLVDSAGGMTLAALESPIDSLRHGAPRALSGSAVSFKVDLLRDRRRVANVVGSLPGSGGEPAHQEYVVIGAHYDHLGWGGAGSLAPDKHEIHHGADDNASGTAAVIELAQAWPRGAEAPGRGAVFVCFVGEEEGLFGSAAFVAHSPVPLEKVAAMINMDMIGRLKENRVVVAGTGTSPVFPALLAAAARPESLTFALQESGYGPSDHTSFYAKDRPVLFFFTGAHSDYHKPTDTWEKINAPGEARIVRMVDMVARSLAGSPQAIAFTHVRSDTARSSGGEGYGGGGYGPYLGTIPDFADNPDIKGVLLSGVREGSPAEKAGIQGGDIIVKFDGLPIANLYDYFYALRDRKPGEVIDLELLRKGHPVHVHPTLSRRK